MEPDKNDVCGRCGHPYKDTDAHFGISHYPFYRAHEFVQKTDARNQSGALAREGE